jgi:hypothetical protein
MVKYHVWKYEAISYAFPLVMGAIFAILNFKASTSASLDNKTTPAFGLLLSIIIPIVIIWLLATYGAVHLKSYAYSIKDSKDGKALNDISNALALLVLYIIILPMVSSLVSLARHTTYLQASGIAGNYIPLIIALISAYLLHRGSAKLVGLVPHKLKTTTRFYLICCACALLFAGFVWQFYNAVPHLEPVNDIPKFVQPVGALVFTYALPHILLWTLSLLACRNLNHYASKVPGSVYRPLFKDLNRGILLAYVCIFLSQLFTISSISYSGVNIGVTLIYGLLILAIVGFTYVARGAQKLNTIESAD